MQSSLIANQIKKSVERLGNAFLTIELREQLVKDQELTQKYYNSIVLILFQIVYLLWRKKTPNFQEKEIKSVLNRKNMLLIKKEPSNLQKFSEINIIDLFELLGGEKTSIFGTLEYLRKHFPTYDSEFKCSKTFVLEIFQDLASILEIDSNQLLITIKNAYENLLNYFPSIAMSLKKNSQLNNEKTFRIDLKPSIRKTRALFESNDTSLVNQLIKGTLERILSQKICSHKLSRKEKEQMLLSLKICDPACGTGTYLIAATRFLGLNLAIIRTGDNSPSIEAVKLARREVLQHCIYGVDINPVAVELTKLCLWIISYVREMPEVFLDHRIKCGNSLIGTNKALIQGGIPNNAFSSVTGDNKGIVRKIRQKNKSEHQKKKSKNRKMVDLSELASKFTQLANLTENSPKEVHYKYEKYKNLRTTSFFQKQKRIYDLWTSAFFWSPIDLKAPTQAFFEFFFDLNENSAINREEPLIHRMELIAEKNQFFHWTIEFPEVFEREKKGFDFILTNPPWERIKIQQKEFFEILRPEIMLIKRASERKHRIAELKNTNPTLMRQYQQALQQSEKYANYLRHSGHFPLTSKGDVNLYAPFAELADSLLTDSGHTGLIIPSGIATDTTNKEFFHFLIDNQKLISFYDFENRKNLFEQVHRSYRFALLVWSKTSNQSSPDFAFFITNPKQLGDQNKHFRLTSEDISLLNPNTRTSPIFRSQRDFIITLRIYRHVPVLISKKRQFEQNNWKIKLRTMFHMTNDSKLFYTHSQLSKEILIPQTQDSEVNTFYKRYVPLYEGRMIDFYDHRYASVEFSATATKRSAITIKTTQAQHSNPNYTPQPRYWVSIQETEKKIPQSYPYSWFLVFQNITASTNERTFICSIIPRYAVGNSLTLMLTSKPPKLVCCLLANLSSLVFDYIVRQKLGGINLNYFIVEQLPVLPPKVYSKELQKLIIPKVVELVYTSEDMREFAKSCDINVPPYPWNEEKRLHLKAELDAIFAHLYGLTHFDLAYILESFGGGKSLKGLKKRELEKYGEFRTKRLVIEYYNKLKEKFNK
ncbi:MAG: Eco57I restriction-modification methylase domain-containing protein [Candidatus Hermodarchaeota archaeon]